MPVSTLLPFPTLTFLITALFAFPPALARSVEIVDLPADPPSRRTVALEEVWRVGGENDEVLLGLVTSAVLDDDGNILLADQQLSHVLVISPEGELLSTLGREGDGPGEMRRLQSAFIVGDRVGMVQGFPGKVAFVDRKGQPAGGFKVSGQAMEGGSFSIRDLYCAGTTLVAKTSHTSNDFDAASYSTRTTLSVLNLDGLITSELVSHEVSRGMKRVIIDEAAAWAEFNSWAVSPLGIVATIAEREVWAVNERNLDGVLQRVLRRPCQSCERVEEEKDEAISRIHIATVIGGATFVNKPLEMAPAIVDLQYAIDGRLFATACHNAPRRLEEGVAGCFDVITAGGEFLEELTVTFGGYDPEQDVLVFLDGTHFIVLQNYEDAEKAIYAAFAPEEEREDLRDAEALEVVLVRMPSR